MTFKYIIEHMEEDEPNSSEARVIPEWVGLEYHHMRMLAGPSSAVHFTNLSGPAKGSLERYFTSTVTNGFGISEAQCHKDGVTALTAAHGVPIEKVCLLDPKAEKEISPEDGEIFDWFLFGGILGDDPPRDRTSELRKLGFPGRHLGPVQMTTDTALGVVKKVVDDKVPLSQISFTDHPTITFSSKESVEMPFRYMVSSASEPLLPPGMKDLLKRDLDRGFEF